MLDMKTKLVREHGPNHSYRITGGGIDRPKELRKLEKLYESKGIKLKLCSYRPVGGKSTLAHLFELFDKKRKLEKLYESKGIKP